MCALQRNRVQSLLFRSQDEIKQGVRRRANQICALRLRVLGEWRADTSHTNLNFIGGSRIKHSGNNIQTPHKKERTYQVQNVLKSQVSQLKKSTATETGWTEWLCVRGRRLGRILIELRVFGHFFPFKFSFLTNPPRGVGKFTRRGRIVCFL